MDTYPSEFERFTDRIEHLTADEITRIASELQADLESVDGEVAWWRATVEIDHALRRLHRTRQAGLAAHRASIAVVHAAETAGVDDGHRAEVTAVARAAAELARALVALGDQQELPPVVRLPLLHPWECVLAAA